MSRFLRTAGSDSSDSSSSDEEESDSDESDAPKTKKPSFMRSDSEDEESEEEGKGGIRILSAQEKRLAEMEASGKVMENALKINDWVAISNEFDKLARMVQRQHNVSEPIPPLYIKTLTTLETSVTTTIAKEKEAKKKMNATNAKALTATKQKVRKAAKEYEKDITKYQADPEAFEREYAAATAKEQPAAAGARAPAATQAAADDDEGFQQVGPVGKALTTEGIYKNLQLVQEARGKKNTDRADQIRILEQLLKVAVTSYQRIRVLLALVSSRFDFNSSTTTYMPTDLWLSAQREVDQLIAIVASDSQYSIQEITEEYDELVERSPATEKDGVVRVRGSIISFIDRLDDEFTRSLQNIDPHGTEYVERLKDEKVLYSTICRAQAFYEKNKQEEPLGRVIMRRLEHIYSKPDPVVQALENATDAPDQKPSLTLSSKGSTRDLIHGLCAHLYKSGNSLLRTRAMLSHIYHYALHNDFHTARDMLLMSHLQETIHSADVATQILYNRTVVQLGLCAFRSGLIKESQTLLQDIFTTQRVKELLAQGVHQQRFQVLTPEQEKAEKQRQLPFHMHINTELLEAAFLVSSMLVEIPLLASIDSEELKRKAISKPFRRLLDFADRQVFTGPPESTRDHIMQASKALQDGEWQKCRDLIQSIKIWSLMPEVANVKEMLARRIQEQGLRTYLFTYAPHYSTLSLSLLARTFDLPLRSVTSIVSKMIWSEELSASLDQSGGVIIFHRIEVSRQQQLALMIAEKINAIADQNEKNLDAKVGGGAGWGDRADGKQGEKRGNRCRREEGSVKGLGEHVVVVEEVDDLRKDWDRQRREHDLPDAPSFESGKALEIMASLLLRCRGAPGIVPRRLFSTGSAVRFSEQNQKPPQPPKDVDDSTSALEYKRLQRTHPPPLPSMDLPRNRTAEEAVTNILYNTPPPSLQPFKKHILNCLVQNEPGVLSRVSGILAGRGFNIDSLVVCRTEIRDLSRMCIVLNGQEGVVEQARRQLEDLVPVWAVLDYTDTRTITRELLLVKVSILGPEYLEEQLLGGPSHEPRRESSQDKLEREAQLAHQFEKSAHPEQLSAEAHMIPRSLTPSEALRLKHQHLQSINTLASQFGAKIVDVSENSVIVELTAKTTRVEAFLGLVKPFGILESARTGLMSMPRTPISGSVEEELVEDLTGPVDASLLPPG
ncbi:Translation initiation factor 3 subunit c [Marasmius tenuissimus]|nr:Translation initiation factor 3 subunit c [Marasmius tenuissimus]